MEAKGHDRMFTVCLCEFLGTALFIFGLMNSNLVLTYPFSLMASVVIFGDITGGHFNPAVSIGVFTQLGDYGKNFMFLIMIIISQVLGGFLAIGMFQLGYIQKGDPVIPILAPVNPITGEPDNATNELEFSMDLQVVINEIVCTFIFVSVILMIKGEHTAGDRKGIAAAICVVVTLLCCISGTNKLGACFNPAVGIALTADAIFALGTKHYLYHYLYAYTLGPATGGLLAGLFHMLHRDAHKPEEVHPEFDQNQKEHLMH